MIKIKNISLKCPQCGAPLLKDSNKCNYCGTEFDIISEKKIKRKLLVKGLKDFGWKALLPVNIAGILILYIWGWILEDKDYWLEDKAIIVWSVIMPLWILIMTFFWLKKSGAVLIGFIVNILIFGSHLLIIMIYENWHFNDDYAGIAAMFAGIAFGAWMLGRFLHYLVRNRINRKD